MIQEIARAHDQPSVVAEHLIDRAAFGDHPLGRPVLGPEEHLRTFTRDAIVAFRSRQWAGSRGGAFLVGNLSHLPDDTELAEAFGRFPSISPDGGSEPAPVVRAADAGRDTGFQPVAPADLLPSVHRPARSARGAPRSSIYSTLLGGSMGSRLFDEIREQRGLAYSVYSADHSYADVPILQLSAGLESGKAVEAFTRMREIVDELRTDGPREDEFERARAYAAGRRVLAFENTNAVARYAASQSVVYGQDIDPDEAIAALDRTTFDQVADVARGISETSSVACVGPHETSDFTASSHPACSFRPCSSLALCRSRRRPRCAQKKRSRRPVKVQLLGINDFHGHLEPTTPGTIGRGDAAAARPRARGRRRVPGHARPDAQPPQPEHARGRGRRPRRRQPAAVGAVPRRADDRGDERRSGSTSTRSATTSSTRAPPSCCGSSAAAATRATAAATARRSAARASASWPPTWSAGAPARPLFPPYAIRKLGGVRIGFIGMTLEGTPDIVPPSVLAGAPLPRRGGDRQPLRAAAEAARRAGDRRAAARGRLAAPAGAGRRLPGPLRAARGHRPPHVARGRRLPHRPHARRLQLRDRPPARHQRRPRSAG